MKEDMARSKFLSAMTAAGILAASFSALPLADALQFHGEQRNGNTICVATSTETDRQITKDHYKAQMNEYLILQDALRAAYPQFSAHYADFDKWIAEGHPTFDSRFYTGLTEIRKVTNFDLYEISFFAVKGTDAYRGLEELAETGFTLDVEFATGWSKSQMSSYPESNVPVVPVGADWTLSETGDYSVEAYQVLTEGMPIGAFNVSPSYVDNLEEFLTPRLAALETSKVKYDAVISPNAILQAARNCLTLHQTGTLPPAGPVVTTTVTPTTTVTAPPVTVTETAEPVTTTVTAPVATVTATPAPVTTTAPGTTVTETPAPVTTTVAPSTTTTTAPVATVTVTPAPVTTTAPGTTVTETAAPVTTTVTPSTATVTPAPVTTTAAPVTVTETAVPVTTTVTPTPTPEPPAGGGNNLGLVAGVLALLATLGGIAVFLANNLGLLQGFF